MPKTPEEILLDLAQKKSLSGDELDNFKRSFKVVANSRVIDHIKKGGAAISHVHEAIQSVTRESGKKSIFRSEPKKTYNLLETALKSQNQSVYNYLIEEFEKSYTSYDSRPKDLQQLYASISTIPPQLPIDRKKFSGESLTYVSSVDGNFELKYARARVEAKNSRNQSKPNGSELLSDLSNEVVAFSGQEISDSQVLPPDITRLSTASTDRSLGAFSPTSEMSSSSQGLTGVGVGTFAYDAQAKAEEKKDAATKIQKLVRGAEVRKSINLLAEQGRLNQDTASEIVSVSRRRKIDSAKITR